MSQTAELRVLLVDDEPLILKSYRRILQSIGAEITLADSPEHGLQALRERPADVIVADYRMPGMNGGEFLERVRREWPQTQRILVTASSDAQMIEDVMRRGGIFRLLLKPFETQRLREVITAALDQSRQQRDLRRHHAARELDLQTYRHTFASALDPMMISDLDGHLLQVNDAFAQLYGVARSEALLCRPTLVSGLDLRGTDWPTIHATLSCTGHWSGEVGNNGRISLLSVSRIADDAGVPYAYGAVEKDVSARHRLEEQTRTAQYEVILALARLAEYRDPETGAHLDRIRNYCRVLATQLAKNPDFAQVIDRAYIEGIYYSSPLHDIGKVGIPDAVLLKPQRLDADEWQIMRRHTLIGAEVLSAAGRSLSEKSWLTLALTIAQQHHEKWDGSGYPGGLRGTAIDLSARIVALADAYDAITSKRSYKEPLSHETARQRIVADSGTHFDPEVVAAFIEVEHEFLLVRDRYADAAELSSQLDEAAPVRRSTTGGPPAQLGRGFDSVGALARGV
ncbi:MAG: response regulator [Proteobacteria bacterium]|nr:response regulator [Pseudomonadota bacterium]